MSTGSHVGGKEKKAANTGRIKGEEKEQEKRGGRRIVNRQQEQAREMRNKWIKK